MMDLDFKPVLSFSAIPAGKHGGGRFKITLGDGGVQNYPEVAATLSYYGSGTEYLFYRDHYYTVNYVAGIAIHSTTFGLRYTDAVRLEWLRKVFTDLIDSALGRSHGKVDP